MCGRPGHQPGYAVWWPTVPARCSLLQRLDLPPPAAAGSRWRGPRRWPGRAPGSTPSSLGVHPARDRRQRPRHAARPSGRGYHHRGVGVGGDPAAAAVAVGTAGPPGYALVGVVRAACSAYRAHRCAGQGQARRRQLGWAHRPGACGSGRWAAVIRRAWRHSIRSRTSGAAARVDRCAPWWPPRRPGTGGVGRRGCHPPSPTPVDQVTACSGQSARCRSTGPGCRCSCGGPAPARRQVAHRGRTAGTATPPRPPGRCGRGC